MESETQGESHTDDSRKVILPRVKLIRNNRTTANADDEQEGQRDKAAPRHAANTRNHICVNSAGDQSIHIHELIGTQQDFGVLLPRLFVAARALGKLDPDADFLFGGRTGIQ